MKILSHKSRNFLKNVYSFASCVDNKNIYLANACDDTIFVFDKNSKKIVDNIELSSKTMDFSISQLYMTDDKIFAIPYYSNRISVIDKNSHKVMNIGIEGQERPIAFYACKAEEYLWLLPQMMCSNMYLLDIKTFSLQKFPSIFVQPILEENYKNIYGHTVFSKPLYIEGSIWFAIRRGNKLIKYIIKDRTWEMYQVPFQVINCTCDGKRLWILSEQSELYRWEQSTGFVKEADIKTEINYETGKKADFENMFFQEGWVYCLPYTSDMLYAYNIKEKQAKTILLDNKEKCKICDYYSYDNGCLYIGSPWYDKMIEINPELSTVNTIEWDIPIKIRERIIERNTVIDEDKLPLEIFLKNITCKLNQNESKHNLGTQIYSKIKG